MKAIDYYAGVSIPDLGDKALDVAVLGNGSFGTAMANLIVHNGHRVTLYGRNKAALDAMKETRVNSRYLPDALLSDRLEYTNDIGEAVSGKDIVVFAVPAQTFRQVSSDASKYLKEGVIAVNLAKGIEKNTLKRMSEVAADTIPQVRYVALSGPTHAEEIVMNAPAGIVAASADPEAAKFVQDAFSADKVFKVILGLMIASVVEAFEAHQWDDDVVHLGVVSAVVHSFLRFAGRMSYPTASCVVYVKKSLSMMG